MFRLSTGRCSSINCPKALPWLQFKCSSFLNCFQYIWFSDFLFHFDYSFDFCSFLSFPVCSFRALASCYWEGGWLGSLLVTLAFTRNLIFPQVCTFFFPCFPPLASLMFSFRWCSISLGCFFKSCMSCKNLDCLFCFPDEDFWDCYSGWLCVEVPLDLFSLLFSRVVSGFSENCFGWLSR